MFRDRQDAAEQLAHKLRELDLHDPVVLAIPRGGVAIGAVLAEALDAELDVALTRKLRAPSQPELAIGAVAEDGQVLLDPRAHDIADVTDAYIKEETATQLRNLAERSERFRAVRPAAKRSGRSVIITDDGIATGATMIAALQLARTHGPYELIAAVPVAPPTTLDVIARQCDRTICVAAPPDFRALSQYYERFDPVDEAHAVDLVRRAYNANPSGRPSQR